MTYLDYTPQQLLSELMAAGMSQSAIGREIEMSQANISRLLSGLHKDMSSTTFRRLQRLYVDVVRRGKP